MPSGRVDQTLYIGASNNIEALNTTTLYKPGELGSQIQVGTKAYQLIQVDSGAALSTAGTPVAATHDGRGSLNDAGSRDQIRLHHHRQNRRRHPAPPTVTIANAVNSVAGVMCSLSAGAAGTATVTSGNFGVIQQRGNHVGVASDTSFVPGDLLVAKTTGATSIAARSAAGTAPVSQVIGKATAATAQVTSGYTPAMLGPWDLVDVP